MKIPFPGTLLNTATVVAGSLIGLLIGKFLNPDLQTTALMGLGLVNIGMGLKMFLQARDLLLVAGAMALGGVLGTALGITTGFEVGADWVRAQVGGGGQFTEGLVAASILFCVGPMTLVGCIEDATQGKSELLRMKSLLDGVACIFMAATLGVGVLASAGVVLVFQGLLTLFARPLEPLAKDEKILADTTAVGGLMLAAIGLSLAGIKSFPVADFLPALVLAGAGSWLIQRWARRRTASSG